MAEPIREVHDPIPPFFVQEQAQVVRLKVEGFRNKPRLITEAADMRDA